MSNKVTLIEQNIAIIGEPDVLDDRTHNHISDELIWTALEELADQIRERYPQLAIEIEVNGFGVAEIGE